MGQEEYLFHAADAFSVIQNQRQQLKAEIAHMDGNRLLNTNVDDLAGYFAKKFSIDVPELHEDQMSALRGFLKDILGFPEPIEGLIVQGQGRIESPRISMR
jgi:hypothetical protein